MKVSTDEQKLREFIAAINEILVRFFSGLRKMIPDGNSESTPQEAIIGKYKEIFTVSNKVNTYLTLSVGNVPPSCMDAGRSTLAECFFTGVGILTAVPTLTEWLWNLCNNSQPNTWFVANPTVFLYSCPLLCVCVCWWGEGVGRCLGTVGTILDPLSLCVPNSGAQMRNCPKKACRIPGRKDRAGRAQPGC